MDENTVWFRRRGTGVLAAVWVSLAPQVAAGAAASGANANIFRCGGAPPAYALRTGIPTPDPRGFKLAGKMDEEIASRGADARAEFLEATPAEGGHSRLGQRYLARVFGYPGEFGEGMAEVESWLASEERSQPRLRGITKVWDKWSKESPLLLTVVDYDPAKSPYDSERLFHGAGEEGEFLGCVARDLAELKCENTSGTKFATLNGTITQPVRVYYHPDPNAQVFCEVRKPEGDPLWYAHYSAQVKINGQRAERREKNPADRGPMEDFTLGR